MSKLEFSDFRLEEFRRRMNGLRELMAASDMDAVLVTTEANHRYFTGHETHRWMHKYVAMFALLPLEGDPVVIVPRFEAAMCEADSWIEVIRTFESKQTRQGVEAIAAAILECGLQKGRIGTELGGMVWMRMPRDDFDDLRQKVPGVDFVDAAPICWKLRSRKSAAEVELIRQAVAITDEVYEVLIREVRLGMSERDVYRLLAVEHLKRGAEMPGSITIAPQVPGDDRIIHRVLRRPLDRVLVEGELVTHDLGGQYRGYWSDYTRMFALESATDPQRDAYRVVYDCLQAALEATKPGRPIAGMVEASRATMKAAGHGDYAEGVASIGHATGLDIIEPPLILLEGDVVLEEGMVFTVEPGLLVDGRFFMLEEDVLVTEDGCEVLSKPAEPELPVL